MESKPSLVGHIFAGLVFGLVVILGMYIIPWKNINWGGVRLSAGHTVTAIGEAEKKERSQIATFVAGVSAVNDNKDTAITDVNTKIAEIIKSLKDFGIKDEDLKTQNLSVTQAEETYYEEGRQKQRPGQWRISNNVEVKLFDVSRASALASLLTNSGATNVYGPNFTLEDFDEIEGDLLTQAVEDARNKAQIMASLTNRSLGEIVSISEGFGTTPVLQNIGFEGGGGGGGLQPGSGTAQKTVTVVFELK